MSDNLVTLAELCATLRIAPRAARMKLRASKVKHDGRYAWGKSKLAKIKAIIQADAPKAPVAAKNATKKKTATKAKARVAFKSAGATRKPKAPTEPVGETVAA